MDKTIYTDFYGRFKFSSFQDLLNKFPYAKPLGDFEVRWLFEFLSQSLYYRPLLRNNPWEVILQLLIDEMPGLHQQMDLTLLTQVIKNTQLSMGDLNIVCVDCNEKLCLNGKSYKGIEDIKKQWRNQKSENRTIIAAYDQFPCFDSSDYANEDRSYWNFWFCDSVNYEKKQLLIEGYNQHDSDYCFLTEKLPVELTPMVYYKDGSNVMLVANSSCAERNGI